MGIFWTDVNFKYKGLVDFERSLTLVLFLLRLLVAIANYGGLPCLRYSI